MRLFEGERHTHSGRRSDSCLGWHCLSSATRFGIIFSTVVVFIILSILWMYCMGRARIFRKLAKPHNVSRRPRNRQHHRNPNPARPVQHVVQRIPVLQYGVAQQAPIYFFSGPQVPTARPLGVMNAHVHLPASTCRPLEAQQPKLSDDTAPVSSEAQEHRQGKAEPSDDEPPSHHLTWWQRFYRAFNLPVGAASTVASSPSPSPSPPQPQPPPPEPPEPPRTTITNIRDSATYPSFQGHTIQVDNRKGAGDSERLAKDQDETSSMVCNLDTSSDSVQSIRSDVATVHSDDYEMAPR